MLQDLRANEKRTVDPEKEGKIRKKVKTNENTRRVRTSRREITGSSTAMGADWKALARTWGLMVLPSGIYGHRRKGLLGASGVL
jgi:hypothetical protein